jgi:protocatechuate 3,4-dioxygenase beta subunit
LYRGISLSIVQNLVWSRASDHHLSLVDEIAHKHASESGDVPTSSSILGPFWSPDAPWRENGDSIILSPHQGQVALMHGKVIDLETRRGIPNAVVDIWEASSNGKYDFQDPGNQVPNNLRGKFKTDADGNYHFYCLRPTAYSLPTDGTSTAPPFDPPYTNSAF